MKAWLWCLLLFTPLLQAADWLRWQQVGSATLSWGPFTLYDSQLLTPQGHWQPQQWPLALVITYRRDISRDDLLAATDDQWRQQKIGNDAIRKAWLTQLHGIWPDVTPGSRLAFQADPQGGQFYWQAAGVTQPITAIGPRFDAAFRDAFLAIWLSEQTTYPAIRHSLTGGH